MDPLILAVDREPGGTTSLLLRLRDGRVAWVRLTEAELASTPIDALADVVLARLAPPTPLA